MPKDYFNDPIEKETGQSFKASPQALMFERLVSELQATLEEEVFFDDSDWPHGFDWSNEADAVWEGLAEDATLLAKFRTRSPADQVLCRAAGLIYRAIFCWRKRGTACSRWVTAQRQMITSGQEPIRVPRSKRKLPSIPNSIPDRYRSCGRLDDLLPFKDA